ncbi:DUF4422 domain-containing protein [Candidatus Pelagibacter sp.]|nr:DUF4422 domain-containing protein [Candidatus Pelagibacter sp.]
MNIFCVTNTELDYLEKLPVKLAGVGNKKFSNKYITCLKGKNIQQKEKNYSELTFHYWFWKNKLKLYDSSSWIGFCQKRRFWMKSSKKISSFKDLKNNIIVKSPAKWKNFDSIICKSIRVDQTKKMKLIKRGWKNIIGNPKIFFDEKERSIKLHFDMHHGYGILEESIKLMNSKDKDEFKVFVNEKKKFNPHIMFISKKKIINEWFKDLFEWLFKCEKVFGLSDLKGYDQERLYAYLAERYLSFWFRKHTKFLEWHWSFYERK